MCSEKLKTLITENVPSHVTESAMWHQMDSHPELQRALIDLREIAAALSAEVARVNPGMTDHSVKHFDALWAVSDEVLTPDETAKCSAGESFILGSSFYVHDLGMAFAATKEGGDNLRDSDAYKSTLERLTTAHHIAEEQAKIIALQVAGRQLHAYKARELILQPLPGLNRYLIETTTIREKWATFIADVSESHHWSITEVELKLGKRGRVPAPISGEIDLGFVACALRVIDYAHINFERANYLTRLLRYDISDESLLHWLAQENITGPRRQGELLVFGCTKPIENVDAWWLFYEIADGLDREIHAVEEYLSHRADSVGRFSLQGVKGTRSPQSFANLVLTDGFDPVDIRFRPDSIERLVDILGGRTLYGDDIFAPIRELLQNARDAIYLQRATNKLAALVTDQGRIVVKLEDGDNDKICLIVSDTGIGMSADVITNYLLGIASDYWHSPAFYSNYPGVSDVGFKPAGRFGIGFLSIFMIGQTVGVETQRRAGPHLKLKLSGVGKRGALVTSPSRAAFGTTVRIELSEHNKNTYTNLVAIVRARAPMLDIPIIVGQEMEATFTINPGWWKMVPLEELHDFVIEWETIGLGHEDPPAGSYYYSGGYHSRPASFSDLAKEDKWLSRQPEIITETSRVMAIPRVSKVLVCTRGIAVECIAVPGIVGIVEAEDLDLVAARSEALRFNASDFRTNLIAQLKPRIIESLDALSDDHIPNRFRFLANVGSVYGKEMLLETNLSWITVVDRLGNAMLMSPNDVLNKLSQSSDVLISYGVNPWNAVMVAKTHFPSAPRDALLFVVPKEGQSEAGSYKDVEDITTGPLFEHFVQKPIPVFLAVLLQLVSSAWGVTSKSLETARWSRNKTLSLHVHLKKLTDGKTL